MSVKTMNRYRNPRLVMAHDHCLTIEEMIAAIDNRIV